MYELKTNTAVRIPVGPLVDPTDAKTAETALTVTDLSVQLYQIKTDGSAVVRTQFAPTASGGNNDMALVTSSTDGMYDLELTAAQLNWLGTGRITFYDVDGFLVHWIDIHVVSAAYFDFKYGSSTVPSDVQTIKTQTVTCAAGVTVLANVGFAGAPGANNGPLTTNGTKANQTVDLTAGQSIGVSGDFSGTMKTSLNAATPASVQNIPIDGTLKVSVNGYESGKTPLQPTVAGRTITVAADGSVDAGTVTVGDVTLAAVQPNYAPAIASDIPTADITAIKTQTDKIVFISDGGDEKVEAILTDATYSTIPAIKSQTDKLTFSGTSVEAILAAASLTAVANAIKAAVVETEGNYTIQQILSIALAVLAGQTDDGGATFKTPNGSATRAATTLTNAYERTSVTLTPSA